jgi:hypothetical protein
MAEWLDDVEVHGKTEPYRFSSCLQMLLMLITVKKPILNDLTLAVEVGCNGYKSKMKNGKV